MVRCIKEGACGNIQCCRMDLDSSAGAGMEVEVVGSCGALLITVKFACTLDKLRAQMSRLSGHQGQNFNFRVEMKRGG